MKTNNGFVGVAVLIILGIIVVGGVGYVAMNPEVIQPKKEAAMEQEDDGVQTEAGDHQEVDHEANEGVAADAKVTIAWRFADAGEIDAVPHTAVTVVINGKAYAAGTFEGSCSELDASGGIDGTGLLAGELSAVQCWFAGGGNEIGVFAHEDGGVDIMVGELSEGEAGAPLFRGDFSVKSTLVF